MSAGRHLPMRIGQGFDVHAFDTSANSTQDSAIVLGGVSIPYQFSLAAHSDGDVLLHAVCDALLGALALGDIGKHFPDSDPQYANISSLELLTHCYQLINDQGYALANLDSTIIAQAPKMAPFIDRMRDTIALALRVDKHQVSVKATTSEKLGFTGRGEGIACQATVLLFHKSAEYCKSTDQ